MRRGLESPNRIRSFEAGTGLCGPVLLVRFLLVQRPLRSIGFRLERQSGGIPGGSAATHVARHPPALPDPRADTARRPALPVGVMPRSAGSQQPQQQVRPRPRFSRWWREGPDSRDTDQCNPGTPLAHEARYPT